MDNPLAIRNKGSALLVDRSQFFSFFNSDEGTNFTAKEFALAGEALRPQIAVTLNDAHSEFKGKIGPFRDGTPSSFDLVLQSMPATLGITRGAGGVTNPNQAMLTLANPDNDITGETTVTRGVLAVGGAKSIADKGTGNLYVGVNRFGFTTTAADKAVFLGLANATFKNKTIVDGNIVAKPAVGNNIQGNGALAASTGTTTAYMDVELRRAIEINPQAVGQAIAAGINDDIRWTNTNLYPTWGGTVKFGGVSADYRIMQSKPRAF